jgi:N4-(beta-N-acetylglucosaminyl)-L-asparaginase
MSESESTQFTGRLARRDLLSAALGSCALAACAASTARAQSTPAANVSARATRKGYPVLVGSNNALPGMQKHYAKLLEGADPLDVVIEVVKLTEADPNDDSVGLGGLPNEEGVVQLDAACMYGPRHKSGAVACIENILHPSEVARLVLERTDHCLLVGKDAYRFARAHGHEHVELLTEASRKKWLEWKENLSKEDDRLPPPAKLPFQGAVPRTPARMAQRDLRARQTGTIHCSGLAKDGALACVTTTSGLSWKIPGRVGDSPILGAGLYCDQEAGSAGATGRGEANILANGAFTIVELMRNGAPARDAALETLRRVTQQTQRQARYQPELVRADGLPSFNLTYYVLALDGSVAGAALHRPKRELEERTEFAAATPERGPHLAELVWLHG